jgi:hypothetical protein
MCIQFLLSQVNKINAFEINGIGLPQDLEPENDSEDHKRVLVMLNDKP